MLNSYERYLLLKYLSNMIERFTRRWPEAQELVEWLAENGELLELDGRLLKSDEGDEGVSVSQWRTCRQLVDQAVKSAGKPNPDPLFRRLRRLGEVVGLSPDDISILQFFLRYETHPVYEDMIDKVNWKSNVHIHNLKSRLISAALGMSAGALRQRMAAEAPLVRSGLLSVDEDQDVSALERLRWLGWSTDKRVDVRKLLLGATRKTELKWSDFDHLGQGRTDVEGLLRGALESGTSGVNVLVYGPPGTGKTEFCKVLAERLGVELFSVGEADQSGDEPTRKERMAELRLAQTLLGQDSGAVLLFDEMDDLFSETVDPFALLGFHKRRRGHSGSFSKVFMNRLLENNSAPTLWTTNETHGINAALLRRMIFALEMRLPPPRIRARIWTRQLASRNIEATEADALALAHEFDAPPGVAAGATMAADLGDGGFDLVHRSVGSLSRMLGCDRPGQQSVMDFDPALVEADIDLADLVTRLEKSGERRFSLCLQGPPGTGKSAYVRYLAGRLNLEVLHKRTSDLLSMWVGETEQNIARAFAKARDTEAFLIFDEADSLLADRRNAHRSWEVSQVNEMLTWMESHPLPFACTTNYGENLDSATLRRFVFKVTLDFLKPASAVAAFRAWFGLEAPRSLHALNTLTPGDFAVVHRKAEVLGNLSDGEALVELLRAECAAKPKCAPTIGFRIGFHEC